MKKIILILMAFSMYGAALAQYETYRIGENENLSDIADKFEVSKQAILELNPDLKKGDIAHKVIILPPGETTEKTAKASMVRFKEYRVKPKETLYSLAKRNNITVEDIQKHNPYLYEEQLGENDMIKIPIYEEELKDFNISVQTSTFENLIHIVMPKETKYGISKHYGMSVSELDSLNPLIKELQPGQFLKVKNPKAVKKEKVAEFNYYKVQPKETFYGLTKKLNISQDSLERLNPILKELGLQAGMELRVPTGVGAIDEVLTAGLSKTNLFEKLKPGSHQKAAILLPFNLNQLEDPEKEQEDILRRDAYLQISLDLYSGIKMALDSAHKMGISIKAEVFDTQRNSSRISQILKNNNFEDTRFMIGPLLPIHIEQVAKELRDTQVAIFSPLTSAEINGSEKIFQSRPSSSTKEKVLLDYLKNNQQDKNLLILEDKNHLSFTNQLRSTLPGLKKIQQAEKEYLQRSDLTKVLDESRPNWVIIETDDLGAINNAISNLNAIRSKYEIRVFTSDIGKIHEAEVESEYLSHLNFTYASVDRGDTETENNLFSKKYFEKYGIHPSSYAIRGFDVTLDAVLRSAVYDDIFEASREHREFTEYVENRFHYLPKSIHGFYNNAVYLIQFDTNLQLKVIN